MAFKEKKPYYNRKVNQILPFYSDTFSKISENISKYQKYQKARKFRVGRIRKRIQTICKQDSSQMKPYLLLWCCIWMHSWRTGETFDVSPQNNFPSLKLTSGPSFRRLDARINAFLQDPQRKNA